MLQRLTLRCKSNALNTSPKKKKEKKSHVFESALNLQQKESNLSLSQLVFKWYITETWVEGKIFIDIKRKKLSCPFWRTNVVWMMNGSWFWKEFFKLLKWNLSAVRALFYLTPLPHTHTKEYMFIFGHISDFHSKLCFLFCNIAFLTPDVNFLPSRASESI